MSQINGVEFMVGAMGRSIVSRHQAEEILHKVADAGSYGGFPEDVTCEDLGKALFRVMINAPGKDPLLDLLKGFREAEAVKHEEHLNALRSQDRKV